MAGIKGKSGRKAGETMDTVFIKLPTDVLVTCKRAAKADGRPISSYLRQMIIRALATQEPRDKEVGR